MNPPTMNRQIVLKTRPDGRAASVDDFELVERLVPELQEGEVLVRNHYLSLDPYMRGRMGSAKSYAAPHPLGQVMLGGTVGEVVASRHPGYKPGDMACGLGGWQEYFVALGSDEHALHRVDTSRVPPSAWLGVVGMPGVTAWVGLTKICAPQEGETVVVSAASGAVGGVVGQLAKARGCRVIGIAGGARKCEYVRDELGFDDCVDYKAHPNLASLAAALAQAAPEGFDCCFENVGGMVFDAILGHMNPFGRIALCGMISRYDGGQPYAIANGGCMLTMRLKLQGFIVYEHLPLWPEALAELVPAVAEGRIKYRESIVEGLEQAPAAMLGLLQGQNFGKQLVKLV